MRKVRSGSSGELELWVVDFDVVVVIAVEVLNEQDRREPLRDLAIGRVVTGEVLVYALVYDVDLEESCTAHGEHPG